MMSTILALCVSFLLQLFVAVNAQGDQQTLGDQLGLPTTVCITACPTTTLPNVITPTPLMECPADGLPCAYTCTEELVTVLGYITVTTTATTVVTLPSLSTTTLTKTSWTTVPGEDCTATVKSTTSRTLTSTATALVTEYVYTKSIVTEFEYVTSTMTQLCKPKTTIEPPPPVVTMGATVITYKYDYPVNPSSATIKASGVAPLVPSGSVQPLSPEKYGKYKKPLCRDAGRMSYHFVHAPGYDTAAFAETGDSYSYARTIAFDKLSWSLTTAPNINETGTHSILHSLSGSSKFTNMRDLGLDLYDFLLEFSGSGTDGLQDVAMTLKITTSSLNAAFDITGGSTELRNNKATVRSYSIENLGARLLSKESGTIELIRKDTGALVPFSLSQLTFCLVM